MSVTTLKELSSNDIIDTGVKSGVCIQMPDFLSCGGIWNEVTGIVNKVKIKEGGIRRGR